MEALKPELFVPDYPTLYPGMLFARRRTSAYVPFEHPSVHWFYFARNAVWLTVKMFGLEGGEVLVPAYHHGVEIEALVDAGAQPVFYRVGPTWEADLTDIERRITPRTRALYVTHYAGFPQPVREMKALAERHGLPLIEDCALSLLSADGDVKLGTVGDVGIFCLYKTLPTPNGGALVVNGERRYSIPRLPAPNRASTFSHTMSALLKNVEMRGGPVGRWVRASVRALGHGAVKAGNIERVATGTMHFDRAHVDLGISPLTLRIAQSLDLHQIVENRRRNYFYLLGRLREVSTPLFNELPPGVCPLFYPLVVEDKPRVLEGLRAAGVHAVDFWRDHHPACNPNEFPDVMRLRQAIVEIPCHQDLEPDTMSRVAQVVRNVLTSGRRTAPRRTSA
ncbi:MAG: DegT/DnrJ/EryC1/StrS aminotransferase family protein [Myxococcaceae bacterium]|nr:DegT/DnrJ/EryC1/StrS aminotransferase family protein [Myxococcaceae bacterium]